MTRNRLTGIVGAAGLAGGLAGCSYSAPTLRVADAKVIERTEHGLVLFVGLEAENRNEIELPLREIRYSVSLDGGKTFTGVRSPEASLRRLGTQRIGFPAVFPLDPAATPPSGTVQCEVSGSLGYVTPGEFAQVLFDTGVRRPSVSFRGQAPVDLNVAPAK
jgi:hypothetical protein